MTPKRRPIGEWDERHELPEAVGKGPEGGGAASWVLVGTSLLILSLNSYDAAGVHVGAAFKKTVKKGSEKEVQRTPD